MARRQSGFSIIELMIVVAIIGILAAIGIPMFASHMKTAKQTEAQLMLDMLGKNAKTYYQTQSKFPQGTAAVLPGADGAACNEAGKKFARTSAWDADPMWTELDFRIDDSSMWSYHYESTSSTEATALAVADLDCDKTLITYRLELSVPSGLPVATVTPPPPGAD